MRPEINFNTMYEDATDFDCLLGLKVKLNFFRKGTSLFAKIKIMRTFSDFRIAMESNRGDDCVMKI